MSRGDAICVDMDGTLVDVTKLRHYVEGYNKDYDAFHTLSSEAPPIEWVVNDIRRWFLRKSMPTIFVVSARQEKYRALTEAWLEKQYVYYHYLMMRPTGDYRPDYDVKQEILDKIQASYTVVHAYDDNPSTYKLWLERGIPTTIVPGWKHDAV